MKTLLFVHGTGVRAKAFKATQHTLQRELRNRPLAFADYQIEGCYWGDDCGVKLPQNAKSIPNYDSGDRPTAREAELTKWLTLACDPYFELRELIRQDGPWSPAGAERRPPCVGMPATIGSIPVAGTLKELLDYHDLAPSFRFVISDLADSVNDHLKTLKFKLLAGTAISSAPEAQSSVRSSSSSVALTTSAALYACPTLRNLATLSRFRSLRGGSTSDIRPPDRISKGATRFCPRKGLLSDNATYRPLRVFCSPGG